MAWSFAVAQFTKDGADNTTMPLDEVVRDMTEELVSSGIARRIGDTTFIQCKNSYLAIKDNGFVEFAEPAA